MADVPGKFFSATKVRTGVAPSSSGSIVGEPLPPVNPPGSSLNSVGLTMPSAFTVSNSPLTANGTIGVAGAGTVGQYIRGDGSLADFPQASGGGSSVSYYLNGSISQGTIGGVAYKELNKVPILGAGTDFTINADGYIASFITDAGDPNLLEIPGGNWNFETYFSASSSGGSPSFYVELYKYDGTTFTLIASSSSSPELIAFGTNLNPYFSTLAVPTTTLALTDRLAIRYYVTHSGRTITLHTENNHLCQVVTTFTTGLTSLNGLTAQVQNLAVGTSGTDFNISSATATHTFNLPTASATNRGALSSADWALFTQAYNDKINSAAVTGTTTKTLTLTQQDGGTITASWSDLNTDAVTSVFGRTGAVVAANGDYTTAQVTESGNLYYTEARVNANTNVAANTAARHNAVTLGTANGLSLSTQQLSLALASGSTTGALSSTDWNTFNNKQPAGNYVTTNTAQTISGEKTFTNSIILKNSSTGLVLSSFYADRLQIGGLTYSSEFIFPATSRFWNLPDATGTIALVGGSGVGTVTSVAALTLGTSGTDLSSTVANGTTTPVITLNVPTASATNRGALSAADWTTFNNKQNTITLTTTGTSGAATLVGSTLNIPQYQSAGTYVTSVTASSPLASSGGTTPNITIQQSSGSQNGFLSSTDWTTFNNKQNALTNPVTGTGTTNYLPKFTGTSTIGNSNLINDASGNLGLGVTPSAWGNQWFRPIQLGDNGAVIAGITSNYSSSPQIVIGSNYYLDSSDVNRYVINGESGRYRINGASHQFQIASSGTAGNAITFTQAMTLTSGGNLILTTGTVSDNGARLQVSGKLTVTHSSTDFVTEIINTASTNPYGLRVKDASGAANNYPLFSVSNNAGSVEYFRVNSGTGTATFSSSVGVGGTNTDSLLTINGTAGTTHERFREGSTTIGFIGGANGLITGQSGKLTVRAEAGLVLSSQGNSPDVLITSGNLLVGATSDNGARLQVSGISRLNAGTTSDFSIVVESNSNFAFGSTNGRRTGTITRNSGDKPGLQFGYDATDNTGILAGATESLGAGLDFYTYNGSSWGNRMRITSSGNVGIGTNTPEATGLTIAGGGIIASLDSGANRKVIELYASSTGAKVSSTYVGSSSYDSLELLTSNIPRLTITAAGEATFSNSVKTGAPSGGTAQPWRLGSAATVSPTSPNRTIEVEVNGTTYYLHAKTTNN